jgi:osmotically inducible protein OsmC
MMRRTRMPVRSAQAEWKGSILKGSGHMRTQSGSYEGKYSVPSRFGDDAGTNPEELIAAAHAGCYSMALAAGLTRAGHEPTRISTTARVHIEKVGEGWEITTIDLETEAAVPGVDPEVFAHQAETAKKNCPVSKALAGPTITLKATLL